MECHALTCTHTLRPHETDAGQQLCGPCVHAIRRWLASIPATMVVLAASIQRETTGAPTRSGSRTAPLPGRADTLNLCGPWAVDTVHDEHGDQCGPLPIAAVLHGWARLVAEERHLRGPATVTETALAAYLDAHLDWAAGQPWAGEMHDELLHMMGRIWHITSTRPRVRPVTRPCPRCDVLALTEEDGDQYVRCGGCGTAFTKGELNDDAGRRAAVQAA